MLPPCTINHATPLHHNHAAPLHHNHAIPLHHNHVTPLHHNHATPLHHNHVTPYITTMLTLTPQPCYPLCHSPISYSHTDTGFALCGVSCCVCAVCGVVCAYFVTLLEMFCSFALCGATTLVMYEHAYLLIWCPVQQFPLQFVFLGFRLCSHNLDHTGFCVPWIHP